MSHSKSNIKAKLRVDSFAPYAYSCRFGTCKFSIVFWPKNKRKLPRAKALKLYEYGANESTLDYERFGKKLHVF